MWQGSEAGGVVWCGPCGVWCAGPCVPLCASLLLPTLTQANHLIWDLNFIGLHGAQTPVWASSTPWRAPASGGTPGAARTAGTSRTTGAAHQGAPHEAAGFASSAGAPARAPSTGPTGAPTASVPAAAAASRRSLGVGTWEQQACEISVLPDWLPLCPRGTARHPHQRTTAGDKNKTTTTMSRKLQQDSLSLREQSCDKTILYYSDKKMNLRNTQVKLNNDLTQLQVTTM